MEVSIVQPPTIHQKNPLERIAIELEANFLAQMLDFSGLGETSENFGGGAGEDAFSGFLVQEQAKMIAENGGIGLAESIVKSLLREQNND